MNHIAHTLLSAIRYAHGRSLHPYEHVVVAFRQLWPTLDPDSRQCLLNLVRSQVPDDLQRMIGATRPGSIVPVSRQELEDELKAYRDLIAWCEQNTAAQISVSLSGARILIAEKDDGISVSISAECDKESGSIVETFVTYNELKTDKGES